MRVEVVFTTNRGSIFITEVVAMTEIHTGSPHIAISHLNSAGHTTTKSFPIESIERIIIHRVGEGT